MKRERFLRWYGYQFDKHFLLSPNVAISWDGWRWACISVGWFLWGCEIQVSLGRDA